MTDQFLAMVVLDGPPPPCEAMERRKMLRKTKREPRRFPDSFDPDEHQRKTAELADGWKRRQDLKKNKFELDESRLERLPIELWEVADVLMWLDRVNLSHLKTAFDENNIDGPALIELGPSEMNLLGITALAHRKILQRRIDELESTKSKHITQHPQNKTRLKHWSTLKPVSSNQVATPDMSNADEFDEAGARADFQRAVMEWRRHNGKPEIVDFTASASSTNTQQKAPQKGSSLLASFNFGSESESTGEWKNPFA